MTRPKRPDGLLGEALDAVLEDREQERLHEQLHPDDIHSHRCAYEDGYSFAIELAEELLEARGIDPRDYEDRG